jgi:tetratricopeptide (TPR) repeat protein
MHDRATDQGCKPTTLTQGAKRSTALHRAVLTIVVPLFLIACAEPPAPPERASLPDVTVVAETPASVDKLAFIRLLKDRQFEALDAWLTAHQEAFEAGRISDNVVRYAFDAFAYSDPATEALLDQWVSELGASYSALMARSIYYAHRAYITRNLYMDTPRDKVAEMESYQSLAIEDASKALRIHPTLSIAYLHLNTVSRPLTGVQIPKSETRHWVEQGLEKVPLSIALRRAHLDNLASTPGGSLEEIKSFIEATQQTFAPDANLGVLLGYANYATALVVSRSGRYADAVRMIDRALAFGDDPEMRLKKADFLHQLKRSEELLKEMDQAVRLEPQSVWYLNHRASRRRTAGQIAEASADYDLILELDPYEPRFLRGRAVRYLSLERYDEALADIDRALVYSDFDPVTHMLRGKIMLGRPGETRNALAELEKATQMAPDHLGFLFEYGIAIAEADVIPSPERECKSADLMVTYQRLCRHRGFCPSGALTKSDEILDRAEKTGVRCG